MLSQQEKVELIKTAREYLNKAQQLEKQKKYKSALGEYKKAKSLYENYLKNGNPQGQAKTKVTKLWNVCCTQIALINEQLSKFCRDENTQNSVPDEDASNFGKDKELSQYIQFFRNKFKEQKPTQGFDCLVGCKEIKNRLLTYTVYRFQYPETFRELNYKPSNVLLVGIPGTGKTEIAMALGKEAKDWNFIVVKYSDIETKWKAEAGKRLDALFRVALEQQPVIIYFDELDQLFGIDERATKREDVAGLFCQWTHKLKGEKIILLGASNFPFALDEGILRRFRCVLATRPPTHKERAVLFKLFFGKQRINFTKPEFLYMADVTNGYTQEDILHIVNEIGNLQWNRIQNANYFCPVQQPDGCVKFSPCDSKSPGALRSKLHNFAPNQIIPAVPTLDLFDTAFLAYQPTTDIKQNNERTKKLNEFIKTHALSYFDNKTFDK